MGRNICLVLVALAGLPGCASTAPAPEVSGFRFGQWTMVLAGRGSAEQLSRAPLGPGSGGAPLELFLYWQDGRERALALRFDAEQAKADLRSRDVVQHLRACSAEGQGRIPGLASLLPSGAGLAELPEGSVVNAGGPGHGLRRVGDELVADLSGFRAKLGTDSYLVFAGDPVSGRFCRWELKGSDAEYDDD